MLVGLQSLSKYLPDAEADTVDSWKATLYRRLNSVRLFDRPVPLLLVRSSPIRAEQHSGAAQLTMKCDVDFKGNSACK